MRPVVTAYVKEHALDFQTINFVVKNEGKSPAFDVKFKMIDEPELSEFIADAPFWETNFFKNGLPILGSEQSISIFADSANERMADKSLKDHGRVLVAYSSSDGKRYEEEYVLDMGYLKGSLSLEHKGLHDLYKLLEKRLKQ